MESAVYGGDGGGMPGVRPIYSPSASGPSEVQGFLEVYEESRDEDRKWMMRKSIGASKEYPGWTDADLLRLIPSSIYPAPPRYTGATAALDEEGITA